MGWSTCTFSGHVSFLATPETASFFPILFAFIVGEFLERGMSCCSVNFHWNDAAIRIQAQCVGSLSLAGLERAVITWLLLVAKIKASADDLSDFVYFSSCRLLPFRHGRWLLVPAQDSSVNIVSQASSESLDRPPCVGFPSSHCGQSIVCCSIRINIKVLHG